MPEVDGEAGDAVWLANKLRWSFVDGFGGININNIVEGMKLYGVPEHKRADILEYILIITKEVLNTRNADGTK